MLSKIGRPVSQLRSSTSVNAQQTIIKRHFGSYKNGFGGLQASGHSQFLRHERIPHGKIVGMLVSTSYRTDIHAFCVTWFMNQFAIGRCEAVNPRNRKTCSVSLPQDDADSFVFGTRQLAPFPNFLPQIAERAPFYVQHTVTVYQCSL